MIQTTATLLFQLEQQGYRNPYTKIQRLVREKKLIPIRRGLYETDPNVSPHLLAGVIYSPSLCVICFGSLGIWDDSGTCLCVHFSHTAQKSS